MENDRRRYPRIACDGIAVLDLGSEAPCPARLTDLSAEGCHLTFEAPQSIKRGDEIEMAFEVDNMTFAVRAHAKSVRSDTSLGVYFPDMTETGRTNLQGLIGLKTQFAPQLAANSSLWKPAMVAH